MIPRDHPVNFYRHLQRGLTVRIAMRNDRELYYAHRDEPDTPLAETMEAFDKLIKAGKIRAIGASNLNGWRIAEANAVSRANDWAEFSVIQQRHTYLRPRHGADFGPQLTAKCG